MNNTDTFEAGRTYQVEVWLEANDGYYLNTDKEGCLNVNARINGKPAEVLLAHSSEKVAGLTMDFTIPEETIQESTAPSAPTEPSTGGEDMPTTPTIPEVLGLLGDVNCDEKVNIKDATAIQKHIAGMDTGFDIGKEI
jgi:hypothetical protein